MSGEKYFNDEQLDYMRDLDANPQHVCGCGWYWHAECRRHCVNKEKQLAEDRPAFSSGAGCSFFVSETDGRAKKDR